MVACELGFALWLGVIGTLQVGSSPTPISCCMGFQQVETPVFGRPIDLKFGATCSYSKHKRRRGCRLAPFNERTSLAGLDHNGAIEFDACRKSPDFVRTDCCTFNATGPSTTDPNAVVPEPTSLSGMYTCPDGSMGAFTLTKQ